MAGRTLAEPGPPRGPPLETPGTGARKGVRNGGRLKAGGRFLVGTQAALLGTHPGPRRGTSGRQVNVKVMFIVFGNGFDLGSAPAPWPAAGPMTLQPTLGRPWEDIGRVEPIPAEWLVVVVVVVALFNRAGGSPF